jgi:NADPH:quinone reductase-like Zn-dependent oxidoreductase
VVVFDEFGGPEVLRIADEPVAEPAAGEVRVRIEAFAVNPLDAMMRSGASPAPVPLPHARLGVEGTGVVDALGPGTSGPAVGDPVIITAIPDASARGSYAAYTTLPASRVVARPAGLGVIEAAAVWVAFSTAYGALVEKAGMRPGDRVVVNAATGGVGRAAIQVANQIGAVPIAVTRDPATAGDLGAAEVRTLDEVAGIGADVILDLVMGPGQPELLKAARPGTTLVVAGFLDPRPTPFPSGPPITTYNYRSFEHTLDPVVVRRMAAFLGAGVRLGALRPAVDRPFALDEIVEAHRHLEKGRHGGRKIVVTV